MCPRRDAVPYYIPSPPALYASPISMLSQYPKQCSTVYVLCSDLLELIDYNLLKLEDGYIDPDVDESTKAFVDRRFSFGAEKVTSRNCAQLWLPGEEWTGDVLYEIMRGIRNTSSLPHKP